MQQPTSNGEPKVLFGPPLAHSNRDGRGLGYMLNEKLKQYSDNVFQIDAVTGREETYHDFHKKCIRIALLLKNKGLMPQDRISICSLNHMNSAVPLISAFMTGIIPTTLHPSLSVDDMTYFLNLVKPKMIFTNNEAVNRIKEALDKANLNPEIVVFGTSPSHIDFETCLYPTDEENKFEPYCAVNLRDTMMILFSSGTTGLSKGVCLNHYFFIRFTELDWFSRSPLLIFSPLFWASQVMLTFVCIFRGLAKVVYPQFDANCFWDIIDKYKVQECLLVPHQLQEVCSIGRPKELTNNKLHLKFIGVGGDRLSKRTLQIAKQTFPEVKIRTAYGSTETGIISMHYMDDEHEETNDRKLMEGSCGQVAAGNALKVVDLDTEEAVGPHTLGEIRVASLYTMNGFFGMDSTDAWDSECWLKTGDVGHYDEDGYLYFDERCKQLLKYKAFQVAPAQLESIIAEHPAVKQVVVTGIPHEIDGDHPIAFVVPNNEIKVSPEEIIEFVDKRVDDSKRLRGGVKIVKEFPLTVSGKPKRGALREMVINGKL